MEWLRGFPVLVRHAFWTQRFGGDVKDADLTRAKDWLAYWSHARCEEAHRDDAPALADLIAEVRHETIAQCKAAHDAGLPWGSPEPGKAEESK